MFKAKPSFCSRPRLKGLYYVVLQEREDPSETFEGPTHTKKLKKIDELPRLLLNLKMSTPGANYTNYNYSCLFIGSYTYNLSKDRHIDDVINIVFCFFVI